MADSPNSQTQTRTQHDMLFSQWWGRYVIGLTDEELWAGYASSAALRAAETAWKASAHESRRRATSGRRQRRARAL